MKIKEDQFCLVPIVFLKYTKNMEKKQSHGGLEQLEGEELMTEFIYYFGWAVSLWVFTVIEKLEISSFFFSKMFKLMKS